MGENLTGAIKEQEDPAVLQQELDLLLGKKTEG